MGSKETESEAETVLAEPARLRKYITEEETSRKIKFEEISSQEELDLYRKYRTKLEIRKEIDELEEKELLDEEKDREKVWKEIKDDADANPNDFIAGVEENLGLIQREGEIYYERHFNGIKNATIN